jgi:hypothetical protein
MTVRARPYIGEIERGEFMAMVHAATEVDRAQAERRRAAAVRTRAAAKEAMKARQAEAAAQATRLDGLEAGQEVASLAAVGRTQLGRGLFDRAAALFGQALPRARPLPLV